MNQRPRKEMVKSRVQGRLPTRPVFSKRCCILPPDEPTTGERESCSGIGRRFWLADEEEAKSMIRRVVEEMVPDA
jgi:hypothetical protein